MEKQTNKAGKLTASSRSSTSTVYISWRAGGAISEVSSWMFLARSSHVQGVPQHKAGRHMFYMELLNEDQCIIFHLKNG